MKWNEIKTQVFAECGETLLKLDYKFIRSQECFRKSVGNETRFLKFTLIAGSYQNYRGKLSCGIKNSDLDEIFHRTSGVRQEHRDFYSVISISQSKYFPLVNPEERDASISEFKFFILDKGLPFLEKGYNVQDFNQLLNDEPHVNCPFHANIQTRFHYGLIAAKLAANPRYAELKQIYTEVPRSNNKGFYLPRFLNLVEDLGS